MDSTCRDIATDGKPMSLQTWPLVDIGQSMTDQPLPASAACEVPVHAKSKRQASLIADPATRMARARAKRTRVLTFLRDEIWTTIEVVAVLLGIGYPAAHALLKALGRAGLTTSAPLFVPSSRGVVRVVLHGITAQGLAFAWRLDETAEARKPWEPGKTNALFVPHQIEVQLARIRAEQAGWTGWRPARQLMGLGLPKVPDAEAVTAEAIVVAVEVEREIKTDKRYEAVIGAYVAQFKKDGRWARVDYLCPSQDFAARLARLFGNLEQLRLERRDGQAAQVGRLQQAHLDRFRFYAIDNWPFGKWVSARISVDASAMKASRGGDS